MLFRFYFILNLDEKFYAVSGFTKQNAKYFFFLFWSFFIMLWEKKIWNINLLSLFFCCRAPNFFRFSRGLKDFFGDLAWSMTGAFCDTRNLQSVFIHTPRNRNEIKLNSSKIMNLMLYSLEEKFKTSLNRANWDESNEKMSPVKFASPTTFLVLETF